MIWLIIIFAARMNKRTYYLYLLLIAAFSFFANSCKKEDKSNIRNLLTAGPWQLASLQETHYTGATLNSTDTLNTNCNFAQVFFFSKDNTCTYSNFSCVDQPVANGSWELSTDKLFLYSNIVCRDNSQAGSSTPFANSRIINLGQFSFVIETGDISENYSVNQPRTVRRYGFVRQNTSSR